MKTVFFGPFIGEFGWEFLFWQGWVRKLCKGPFKDWRKIAASVPGRQPFYPYVDEFWTLPEPFLKLGVSGHGYYTDGWRGGYPGRQSQRYTPRSVAASLARLRRPVPVMYETRIVSPDIEAYAEEMLFEFKRRLPDDTQYFVPWKWNRYDPDGIEFGVLIPDGLRPTCKAPVSKRIDYSYQLFECLQPTAEGEQAYHEIMPEDQPLIAVFPRCRSVRRADKNWARENYVELIRRMQHAWPELKVAVVGEPGGAYFVDQAPGECLDLINLPSDRRLDIQVAALKRATFALGSMSGALCVALAVGCPTIIWGFAQHETTYRRANVLGTELVYHKEMDPLVDTVFRLSQSLRTAERKEHGNSRSL